MSGLGPKIANVMLSRNKGGIEQTFLDYNEALSLSGFRPVPIISRGALIEPQLRNFGLKYHTLLQWGWWDALAARRLLHIFRNEAVAAVITHGNRALSLTRSAASKATPVIAVAHNYNDAPYDKIQAVIATTADLRNHLARLPLASDKLFVVPNGTRITKPAPAANPFHDPPVIGVIGRIVKNKGFDIFCDALAILKSQNIPFKAAIAGDGRERPGLERKIQALGLGGDITLTGWIEDQVSKDAFWQNVDIFCLPSLHEPFGIVLLEAWAAGKPAITSDTQGPSSIVADGVDAIIVPKNNPGALAQAIRLLLEQPHKASTLSVNGFNKVRTLYSIDAMAIRLKDVIGKVVR